MKKYRRLKTLWTFLAVISGLALIAVPVIRFVYPVLTLTTGRTAGSSSQSSTFDLAGMMGLGGMQGGGPSDFGGGMSFPGGNGGPSFSGGNGGSFTPPSDNGSFTPPNGGDFGGSSDRSSSAAPSQGSTSSAGTEAASGAQSFTPPGGMNGSEGFTPPSGTDGASVPEGFTPPAGGNFEFSGENGSFTPPAGNMPSGENGSFTPPAGMNAPDGESVAAPETGSDRQRPEGREWRKDVTGDGETEAADVPVNGENTAPGSASAAQTEPAGTGWLGVAGAVDPAEALAEGEGFIPFVIRNWIVLTAVSGAVFILSLTLALIFRKKEIDAEEAAIAAAKARGEYEPPVYRSKTWQGALALFLSVVVALAVWPTQKQEADDSAKPDTEIRTAEVTVGSISDAIMAAGSVTEEETEILSVPKGVRLDAILVEEGDVVEKGQCVAVANATSVMSAISALSSELQALDQALQKADTAAEAAEITAKTAGRVKKIFAEPDVPLAETMYEHGSLMLISLDGLMAVEIGGAKAELGDTVNVTLENGEIVSGRVEEESSKGLTVTMDDGLPAWNETVTVSDEEGRVLGTGQVYIHSELKVMAYSGMTEAVKVKEGDSIKAGRTMLTLKSPASSADHIALMENRAEMTEQLEELFALYNDNRIYADRDGEITDIDEDLLYKNVSASAAAVTQTAADEESSASVGGGMAGDAGTRKYNIAKPLMNMKALRKEAEKPASGDTKPGSGTMPSGGTMPSAPSGEQGGTEPGGENRGTTTSAYIFGITKDGIVLLVDYSDDDNPNYWIRVTVDPSTVVTMTNPMTQEPVEIPLASMSVGTELRVGLTVNQAGDQVMDLSTLQIVTSGSSGSDDGSGGRPGGTGSWSGGMSFFRGSSTTTEEEELYSYECETSDVLGIIPLEEVTLEITVDELDVLQVQVGREVEVRLDAMPDKVFTGIIESLDRKGTNEGGSTKYKAIVRLERAENMLAGMNASVTIPTGTYENLLLIPSEAIFEQDGKCYVYTALDEETGAPVTPVEVTTGHSDGTYTEITSGLQAGAKVYYEYAETVTYSVSEN